MFGKDFVDKTQNMWSMKENIDKLNLIKDKSSLQNTVLIGWRQVEIEKKSVANQNLIED